MYVLLYLYDVMLGIPVSVIGLSSKTVEIHVESNYKTEQFGDPFCKENWGHCIHNMV